MGKVHVLDKHTAELIAAGEVVERPASIAKELVENSIDAGAKNITVEIKNGGVVYLRVTDDGEGIAFEDVPTAFLRHATSKIKTGEDLDAISTLGFRGEALASVCAVSKVELITRTAGEDMGTHYVIEGGEQLVHDECGCAKGTTIIVRNVFYNTPARMKFLKKDVSEANAVASLIDRIALSHPEVSIRFVRDGKETLMSSGDGKLKSAVSAVFGREFASTLIPVDYTLKNTRCYGFISRPVDSRPNRTMQTFFINGRYCRSKTMQAALEEAFKGSVMTGKYPACVLNIELDCSAVDVNVHPAKLEVRFTNERPVFESVYYAVKTALSAKDERQSFNITAKMPSAVLYTPPQPEAVQQKLADIKPLYQADTNSFTAPTPSFPSVVAAAKDDDEEPIVFRDESLSIVRKAVELNTPNLPQNEAKTPDVVLPVLQNKPVAEVTKNFDLSGYRLIGEAFETYIIIERGEELILIDKHAAHERILYEKLINSSEGRDPQFLLEPLCLTMDKEQKQVLLESGEALMSAGFEIEDFGTGTVLVRSVPSVLAGADTAQTVLEIADRLSSNKNALITEKLETMYHTIACRAAVKARDKLHTQELYALIELLSEDTDIRYCPHGRPVYTTIKKRELEKSFGRIQGVHGKESD